MRYIIEVEINTDLDCSEQIKRHVQSLSGIGVLSVQPVNPNEPLTIVTHHREAIYQHQKSATEALNQEQEKFKQEKKDLTDEILKLLRIKGSKKKKKK